MALVFDSKTLFDNGELSDITIKAGAREFKCHKTILCHASEFFKALCGPHSKFKERKQNVIELEDDDPTAVEAVLRHLYNFEYGMGKAPSELTATEHMNVFTTAQKYIRRTLNKTLWVAWSSRSN